MSLRAGVFQARRPTGLVLVLLHQINTGLCGWGDFAHHAVDLGIASVAIDLCGYGASTCTERHLRDPRGQVDLAAGYARESLSAERVVVVGASMGGSQTVRAVASGARVDGWVDISGPSAWDGDRLTRLATKDAALRSVPGLVVFTRSDGEREYRRAQRLARLAGATFLDGGRGHGWDLLTTFRGRLTRAARQVLDFAAGVAAQQ